MIVIAGVLNPLDCPHHMRAEDDCEYREGVVLNMPVKDGKGSFINCGISKVCTLYTVNIKRALS